MLTFVWNFASEVPQIDNTKLSERQGSCSRTCECVSGLDYISYYEERCVPGGILERLLSVEIVSIVSANT